MLEKPVLKGEIITLRPIKAEDGVHFLSFDEEVDYLTGTTAAYTQEQILAHYARIAAAGDRADYAILPRGNPDLILGEVVLNDLDEHNQSANLRIALLKKAYFGKGYGTEAIRLILKYGFERLNLHRIELEVFDFNPRALHVYEKVGFIREGLRREVLYWQGRYHHAIMMGILKSDYEKVSGGQTETTLLG